MTATVVLLKMFEYEHRSGKRCVLAEASAYECDLPQSRIYLGILAISCYQ